MERPNMDFTCSTVNQWQPYTNQVWSPHRYTASEKDVTKEDGNGENDMKAVGIEVTNKVYCLSFENSKAVSVPEFKSSDYH